MAEGDVFSTCTRCFLVKELNSGFYKKSTGRMGFTSYCRDCIKQTTKINRQNRHKDRPFLEKHYNLKSSANHQGVRYNLTPEYLEEIWTGFCSIFGCPVQIRGDRRDSITHAEIDKINPSLGYVKGNVQWVCHRANRIKDNATIDELEMVLSSMRGVVK